MATNETSSSTLSRDERQSRDVAQFVKAVGRKSASKSGHDPNDREFDPNYSRRLHKLPPAEFERLALGENE
ncbi:hypothetical protein [Methylobacterium aquaticum]|jgi:hypothetical protein|uniref:hypothetical protein n=1 Tax=Methylobacterium aquaticum TaxID=270351 RepID=UPI000A683B88|nr:hypothetical protein [Methylobacterium aquaticum]